MANMVALPADDCLYFYKAECVNVVDGDTVDLAVDLGFRVVWTQRFRLMGIDTPELNSTDLHEREEAKQAKDALATLIMSPSVKGRLRIVTAKDKGDKYGRWLADLYVLDLNGAVSHVNQILIDSGLARPYSGGTK